MPAYDALTALVGQVETGRFSESEIAALDREKLDRVEDLVMASKADLQTTCGLRVGAVNVILHAAALGRCSVLHVVVVTASAYMPRSCMPVFYALPTNAQGVALATFMDDLEFRYNHLIKNLY